MRRSALVGLVLVALAGGCTSEAPDDDDGRRARAGEVFADQLSGDVQGHHAYVVVPGLRYDFTVSEPAGRIDTVTARDAGVDDEAGDDVRFVGIAWDREPVVGDTFMMARRDDVPATLRLVVDGEAVEVGDLQEIGRGAYVAVPDDASDVGLEVEYDGLVQTVEDVYGGLLGRPEEPTSLYVEAVSATWSRCPDPVDPDGEERDGDGVRVDLLDPGCDALVSSPLPYYGPLGWAPTGSAWVVARVSAPAVRAYARADDEQVEYDLQATVRLALDGRRPVKLFPREDGERVGEQDDGGWAATAVFRTDATGSVAPLTLVRVLDGTSATGYVPPGAPERLRRTVRHQLR